MAAYRRAAAIGADAVECDVRMTRDGVLVCVHDRQISHTSNGRGVVSALHLDELEQYHFGARKKVTQRSRWAGDEITAVNDEPDVENGLVLTLDRLLDYITATPGTVRLAIETKHPTRHTRKVEEALVGTLERFGLLLVGLEGCLAKLVPGAFERGAHQGILGGEALQQGGRGEIDELADGAEGERFGTVTAHQGQCRFEDDFVGYGAGSGHTCNVNERSFI